MRDLEPEDAAGDSDVPGAYTYLGQFIDHDITFERMSDQLQAIEDPSLTPVDLGVARRSLRNFRRAALDLDSVYDAPAPRAGDKLVLGRVTLLNGDAPPLLRPARKDDDNDLPRQPRNPQDPDNDRAALIGDPRNDVNTLVAQLHVAFLRAHNALIDRGMTFEAAQKTLRQHYQHLVLHDFLERIVDPATLERLLRDGNQIFKPSVYRFFVPFEFSVAAYRFGHSMIRQNYNFNSNFNRSQGSAATLRQLFQFSAFNGQLGGDDVPESDTLPENWIVEWSGLVGDEAGVDKARRFDTRLVEPLFELFDVAGNPEPGERARLAVRNLLRGYQLRMPTGQAVAGALGVQALSASDLEQVAAAVPAAPGAESQLDVLRDAGFLERTPLWYYVLAEAAAAGGKRLGAVGGTIVAEVILGLARRSVDSIVRDSSWKPTLPCATPGRFTLPDLLRLAGVL